MKNALAIKKGSGNVYADLGLPDAEDRLLKARIVTAIGDSIERQGLSQAAAGQRMGLAQPDVSRLLSGRLSGFSLERLIGCLLALGNDVSISVEPSDEDRQTGRLKLAMA